MFHVKNVNERPQLISWQHYRSSFQQVQIEGSCGGEDHTAGRLREAGNMPDVIDCGTMEKSQWQS